MGTKVKLKYVGDGPIYFHSKTDFSGNLKNGDEFEISEELYKAQYENDPRYERAGKEKKKEVLTDE